MVAKLAWPCLIALLILTWTEPPLAQRGNPVVAFDGQTIDEIIGAFMKEHDVPGMTLAIVQAPYIPRVVGYGVADVEKGLLASSKTLWAVGQMTQAYTAVAVMQLVEAGKIALDDPIRAHVSGLPAEWQSITVRQLMGHMSGLPDYTMQPAFTPGREYQAAEIIGLVKDVPPTFKAGTQVANSATDFFLLGVAIERASGLSYQAFVTKNQIERLGLTNTMFASGLSTLKREAVEATGFRHQQFLLDRPYINPTEPATGYEERNGRLEPVAPNAQSAWSGNGAVLASAEDVSLWDIGLAGNLLVSKKENRDVIYHGVTLSDGTAVPAHAGWRFPGHRGLMDITGHVPGFSSYLSRFTDPSELLCVTLLANKGGLDLTELARKIAGAFNPKLGPPVPPKETTCRESCYSVQGTLDRLNADVRQRVTVWQEIDGTVWVGYRDANAAVRNALAAAVSKATTPY